VAGAHIIVLREAVEAGLIIGIVLAVTQGMPSRTRYIAGGIFGGVLGALLVAVFAGALSSALAGSGQEIFNATILGLAVILLTWHNIWMARHSRQISEDRRRLGCGAVSGARSLTALAVVVGLAVLREGSEVVLFLYGVVISSGESGMNLLIGGVLGLLLGAGISALAYGGLVVIPICVISLK
jgi:high-affinity iron transporter